MDTFEAYTVSTSTWATLPSMPSALIGPATVEKSGVVYVRRTVFFFLATQLGGPSLCVRMCVAVHNKKNLEQHAN